jgi:hypothetical protein
MFLKAEKNLTTKGTKKAQSTQKFNRKVHKGYAMDAKNKGLNS